MVAVESVERCVHDIRDSIVELEGMSSDWTSYDYLDILEQSAIRILAYANRVRQEKET